MLTCLGKLCLTAKTNTFQKEQLLFWRWTVVICSLHHIPHSFTAAQPATAAIWYRPKQPQRFSVQLRTPLCGRFQLATAGNRSEIQVFHQHVHFFCTFRHFDTGSVEIFEASIKWPQLQFLRLTFLYLWLHYLVYILHIL